MDKFLELLAREWSVVSQAPLAFALLAVSMFGLAYFAARWKYTSVCEQVRAANDTLKERLHLKTEQAEQYKDRALKYDEKVWSVVESDTSSLTQKALTLVAGIREFIERHQRHDELVQENEWGEMTRAADESDKQRLWQKFTSHGVQVFVDGAHALAHFPFTRDELDCDYYGTSLHKWCMAPIGTGMLYVRREKIRDLWSLMGSADTQVANIRKYEEIGTHPVATHNAISVSLAFHRSIGGERKIARLRLLRNRWAKALMAESDRVQLLTDIHPEKNGAIATMHIDGMDMGKLSGWLWGTHRIAVGPQNNPEFTGIRVTPSVYTSLDEIDRFVDKVKFAIRQGIA